MHFDFHLALSRNAVEAAAARVTLNGNDAQSVASITANAFEGLQEAFVVDFAFDGFCLSVEFFLVLTSFGDDFVEFFFLVGEDVFAVFELLLSGSDIVFDTLGLLCVFADALFAKFDFKAFEVDFFSEEVVFFVVANVVLLSGVFVDVSFCSTK